MAGSQDKAALLVYIAHEGEPRDEGDEATLSPGHLLVLSLTPGSG